jgi:hypothetical protein
MTYENILSDRLTMKGNRKIFATQTMGYWWPDDESICCLQLFVVERVGEG